jgi:hypothetical protein
MYNNFQQTLANNNQQMRNQISPHNIEQLSYGNNQMINQQMGNINNSFAPNAPLIETPNFRNKNELLHNNINDNTIADNVREYTIHIDSADRDSTIFPNQFKFTTSFKGNVMPNIAKSFKNVLYVKFVNIILPQSVNAIDGGTMSTSDSHILGNDRYLILRINELSDGHTLSTGTTISDNTVRLLFDAKQGTYYASWSALRNKFSFSSTSLGNINRLSFELLDSYGQPILFSGLDSTTTDTSDFTHKFNKYTQMSIVMIIGTIENELNTKINF